MDYSHYVSFRSLHPQSETEVQCIRNLQSIAQSMHDAFTDLAKVMRSHILVANAPARMYVLNVRRNIVVEGWTIPESGVAVPSTQQGTLAVS